MEKTIKGIQNPIKIKAFLVASYEQQGFNLG